MTTNQWGGNKNFLKKKRLKRRRHLFVSLPERLWAPGGLWAACPGSLGGLEAVRVAVNEPRLALC